jgi:hypothetical protein
VVTPDCCVIIADGSSLYSPEGFSLRLWPSSTLSMLKIVIFLIFFYRVFFTGKIYALKYIAYRVKYLVTGILLTYNKLHTSAIECKEGLCISRLVDFELLLELKIEQKNGTSLHTPCCRL